MNAPLRFVSRCLLFTSLLLGVLVFLTAQQTDLASGMRLFQVHCAACHGPQGEGGRGPTLAVPKLSRAAATEQLLFTIIKVGIPGTDDNNGQMYFKAKAPYKPGDPFMGGGARDLPGVESYAVVKALEPTTGKQKWEFKLHAPVFSGVMSTAGGLVFGGSTEGYFYALDAVTGKPLWHFMAGAQIVTKPVSYRVNGKQHVAITAGLSLFVFALD